jgi:pyrimidine-nucleoside phosphorylase
VTTVELIAKKRDKGKHTYEELTALAQGAAKGTLPDYQLSAWLMAAYLNPLDAEETAWLTKAMAESGERIDLSGLAKPWVDKHSTGGVGDKTTLVLLPMLAACGLTVVKMSGRGLGITGGTIDKLGSIPGFRLDLTPTEMKEQAARIGLALTGQSPNLAPADKALYALRDVTATVGSIPLIVSSILSKKIAGGADTIVLDVKCGSGAFMPDLDSARQLANSLVETGRILGLSVRASISDMDQPLGSMVGNALEVREAMLVLQGGSLPKPSERFRDLCIHYAAETLVACGKSADHRSAVNMANSCLESGKALGKFKEWITAQGGEPIWSSDSLARAVWTGDLIHQGSAGYISRVSAQSVGHAVIHLGGGRQKKDDVLDLSVGIELHVCVGSKVQPGDRLLTVHASDSVIGTEILDSVTSAITVSGEPVDELQLILDEF